MKKYLFALPIIALLLLGGGYALAAEDCCAKNPCACVKGACCAEGKCSCKSGCCAKDSCNCAQGGCSSKCSCAK